ncbi:hypothetical protein BJX64DRAFT_254289 [Aspergillus heterothallicus]
MNLPVVDFSPWSASQDEAARRRVAQELVDACQQLGFVQIINHSLAKRTLDEAFNWMERLFGLPADEKMKAPHPEGWAVHRGYSWPGLEKVTQVKSMAEYEKARGILRVIPDVKEVYDIGSDNCATQPNQWLPDPALPGFRVFMTEFYWECDRVGREILQAIALGLNLEDIDHLTTKHGGNDNQLRLLHYLPVPTEDLRTERVSRCAAHTDWSSITMLFQDDCGGLEVEDISHPGTFVPVAQVRNSIIMNVGDLLQRWSNDRLRSTNHRVGLPMLPDRYEVQNQLTRERFSIPYFMSPDDDSIIECIPSCMSESEPAKYQPITRADYNKRRAAMMY